MRHKPVCSSSLKHIQCTELFLFFGLLKMKCNEGESITPFQWKFKCIALKTKKKYVYSFTLDVGLLIRAF